MKPLLMGLGLLCVFLGAVGVFLPLLPTTPFLLLAAWCFVKSSDRLYQWLLNNPLLGPFIKTYQEQRAIPLKTKVWVLVLLWISISLSVVFVIPLNVGRITLLVIACIISVVILRVPTLNG